MSVCEGEKGGGVCECEVLFSVDDNGRIVDNLWVSVCVGRGGEKGGVTHTCNNTTHAYAHMHTHTHTTHSHTGHLVIKNKALGGARRTQKPRFRTMYRTFRSTSEEERLMEHMSEVIQYLLSLAALP